MKILVLSKYSRSGASSRLRMLQYFAFLREQGVEVLTQELFDEEYIQALYKKKSRVFLIIKLFFVRFLFLIRKPRCDVIWVEKEIFPWMPYFVERFFFLWLQVPYVLEYDDAIFHSYDLNKNHLIRFLLRNKHPQLIKSAKAVIAGNKYLVDFAMRAGCRSVRRIPTVVEASRYQPENNLNQTVVVGWIGSPSTVRYLDIVKENLVKLSKLYDFEFRVLGAFVDWKDLNVKCIPWDERTEVAEIQKFDIGIMPLVDSTWEKGKCGFKIIQYMACGKPAVVSDVGCNEEIVLDQKTGFLVHTPAEWDFALATLITDVKLRQRFGSQGRQRFERFYSYESTREQVLEVLLEAAR